MLYMESIFNKSLNDKENIIKDLISSGNERCINVFIFLYKFYKLNYKVGKSNHYLVFNAVYIKSLKKAKWSIANYCSMSESTLYRIRNDIVDCFYTCLNENITTEEIINYKG